MGLPDTATKEDVLGFLQTQVKQGLRARVISTGLLGGALEIDLASVPGAPPAVPDLATGDIPAMPNVEPKIADLSAAAGDVLNRVQKRPIEAVMRSAIRLMDSANAFVASDETQKAPQAMVGVLQDLRRFVGSKDVQALPGVLRGGLTDAQSLLGDLRKGDIVGQATTAVANVSAAARSVTDAATGLPALVGAISAMATKVTALPLDDLITSTRKTVEAAGSLLEADGMKSLPTSLGAVPEAFSGTLGDLRAGGAVANRNKALDAARIATEAVAKATDRLPDLAARMEDTAQDLNRLIESYGPGSTIRPTAALTCASSGCWPDRTARSCCRVGIL